MNSLILLLITTYLFILSIGTILSKYFKLPWMFTVVIYGTVLSILGVFSDVFQSDNFLMLSRLGMYFFLFTIGLDLNLHELKKLGKLIVFGNIALVLVEATLIALFIYFFFPEYVNYSFTIAFFAGMAFGTVGEVLLLSIIKEFGVEKTRFGQLALGIGVFDDVFEIFAMGVIVALPAFTLVGDNQVNAVQDGLKIFGILIALILVTALIVRTGKYFKPTIQKFGNLSERIPPFLIFLIFFTFIYLSSIRFSNLGIIAAIFSGIAINELLPTAWVSQYKKPIFFAANFILGPFYFLKLGSGISYNALVENPILILMILLISLSSRIILSYFLFRKTLGERESLVMGVALSNKFSTSVISENLLFSTGLIAAPLYSAIMVVFILMKPIVIGVFSRNLALIKDGLHEKEQQYKGAGMETVPEGLYKGTGMEAVPEVLYE